MPRDPWHFRAHLHQWPKGETGTATQPQDLARITNLPRLGKGIARNENALRTVQKRLQRSHRSCDRHKNSSRRPIRLAPRPKHAAIEAKIVPADRIELPTTQMRCERRKNDCNIATLSSQPRSTQKFFPPTNSACPRLKHAAIAAK